MKIHIKGNPHPQTLDFYKSFAEIVPEEQARVIVSCNFAPVETDRDIVIATNTTGLDHITASNARIISLRDFDLSDFTAVSELCICMAGYLTRFFTRHELKNRTIGIIGYGRIGKQFARYLTSFDMLINYYDKVPTDSWKGDLPQLLKISDIVSLHITADEENRNFMDLEKFKMMKDGAIFLNSARPWLVDREALKWALDNKLAGAWFDFDMPFEHPRLVTTPHIGGSTKESTLKSEMLIAHKIKELYGKNNS